MGAIMKSTIIAERLLTCRHRLGITQAEAAKLIGITQPAYQRYEAGVRSPSIHVVKEIAKAFNVSVQYLSGESSQAIPDYIVIDRQENPILFSFVEQFKDFDEAQLKLLIELTHNINKTNNKSKPD